MWEAIEASLPELQPWMFWANGVKDDTRGFLKRVEDAWRKDESFNFSILMNGAVVGGVGFPRVDREFSTAEVGYWIRSDLAGKGLMTEAVATLVDWAFEELGLHRVELHAAVGNHGSVRVAEKIGFTCVGVLRHGGRGLRDWHDCWVYDLLEGEERLRPAKA